MLRRSVVAVATVLLWGTLPMAAQGPRLSSARSWDSDSTAPESTGRLVVGGLVGTAAAVGVGTLIYQLAGGGTICGDDPCGLVAGIVMAILVEPAVVPLGVHLANHRRGSFAADLFASAVAAGAIMVAGSQLGLDQELLIVIPIGQIAASVLAERITTRH